jgi:exopolyphosphatase/guanosine-5'-triphosphate,3'-diphosphate pyrophosphatase
MPRVRVAVVDIGTNSTRLLVADVHSDRSVDELVRHSEVTRLGQGVDATGALAPDAMARVFAVLAAYRAEIDEHRVERNLAVLTSAVRDAANGAEFTARVRGDYGLDARTLSGDEEAGLTFLGATSGRADDDDHTLVVIDIGGGSTEFIIGAGGHASFHVSTQAGVVRMTERHIDTDPPRPQQLQALEADTHEVFDAALPREQRDRVTAGIAVAGTATSAAAIELELVPYDPDRVHGHRLLLATVELLLARLADMDNDQRRRVAGLHPDRAPTIVAGMILLAEAMRAFGLDAVEVSEHDILRGGALRLAGIA